MGKDEGGYVPLFETKRGRCLIIYRLFSASVFISILSIWIYRATHFPTSIQDGRLGWFGLFGAEVWFGLYWVVTQSVRWTRTYRTTFPHNLSIRYGDDLARVDIFVCTADPTIEPPVMVINTILSVMAYDYPPDKLSVYLSDDGGSDLTFYAVLKASGFAREWIPYCKKWKVEPRSPSAYLASFPTPLNSHHATDLAFIKNLYEHMEDKIETVTKLGRIPEESRSNHKGFSQWDSFSSKRDHDTILQIVIGEGERDVEGCVLPRLVYLAREKRPQYHHNFKAGAMNALIRVSSEMSKGEIIMNVDCDMYSNNSNSVRDALCFFMDEQNGHDIAFVQFPQNFMNITHNDLYANALRVIAEVEFHGVDGFGGVLYVGTGCFHRRDTLCGKKFSKEDKFKWTLQNNDTEKMEESMDELQSRLKILASCTYEHNNPQWGKEMGLKYGCPVEDVITGLSIQCRGWKSVYYNPKRHAFLGVASTSLDQTLVQHKRWSEGDFQILLSNYSPLWYGLGKISPGLLMCYLNYCLWAPNCLATLYYSIVPSLYLLKGVSLFPKMSSLWFVPFGYVILARYGYSLAEFLWSGGTVLGWWNDQRIWLYKRTTSYFFALVDTILLFLGFANSGFVISTKVTDEEESQRYQKEMMEFGSSFSSPMFTILASIAMVNLMCLFVGLMKIKDVAFVGMLSLQILLSGILVLINLPLYGALFIRKDSGKMATSVATKSLFVALFLCSCFIFSH